ncbi:MAG: tRNA (adenosine(37)-N6)-threonylcarbamoyltransferase complex transferase subunit TsaD, partial [Balneolaceae bacterium]
YSSLKSFIFPQKSMTMTILGIESSCDETAAAVYDGRRMLSNVIASQAVHKQFGGIVPELASRAHHKTISRTVTQALDESGMGLRDIEVIAVTQGPGLMGSLLVGLSFAKGLALIQNKPIIGVNHIDAHMYANFIDHPECYPFVCLTVSGGHTRLVHVNGPFEHTLLGATRDDAAGEAFDKIGKLLGLPYPGGPEIDKLAQKGNPRFHDFPKSMLKEGFEFSFSGLKTSVLYYLQDKNADFIEHHLEDLCASISDAITEVLVIKLKRAVKKTRVENVMLAGGVSANSMLRAKSEKMAEETGVELMIPKTEYCTDNAAMIAITGYLKARRGEFDGMDLKPFARMERVSKQ